MLPLRWVSMKGPVYPLPVLSFVWNSPLPLFMGFFVANWRARGTPRFTIVYDKVRLGAEIPKDAKLIHQERAYTSPIWYKPED